MVGSLGARRHEDKIKLLYYMKDMGLHFVLQFKRIGPTSVGRKFVGRDGRLSVLNHRLVAEH
jgi:hypothetical protein